PFTNDFPRANINELLSPDILHQVIKGTFKDHLVAWIEDWLVHEHGKTRANEILADIDRRIAAAPPFAGLRRFPEGRGFKQWTGDDSKALMKVYIPAIAGHIPDDMVRCLTVFMDFCYIARRNIHTDESLEQLDDALKCFHQYREIFWTEGVRSNGFSLPRQHSLLHCRELIKAFGAPNGLCLSITESKHIKAVKEPWRRSSRHNALSQMLLTNQRSDKLAASRVDFGSRGMLEGTCLAAGDAPGPRVYNHIDLAATSRKHPIAIVSPHSRLAHSRCPERKYSKDVPSLAAEVEQPRLLELICRFLYDQLEPESEISSDDISIEDCPCFNENVYIYYSAAATFFAPSDPCGVGGMHREHIRATPSWYKGPPRYDCVFVNTDPNADGMLGLEVARIHLFMSFRYHGVRYPCALVHWYERIASKPDDVTGLWQVGAQYAADDSPILGIIHLDTITRAAHLMPQYGKSIIPAIQPHETLDATNICTYFVNKYIDHHAFETLE
ncbi:hypothetical protein CERSUDRAFT_60074, partial [Gelatoporia subvermispora B]